MLRRITQIAVAPALDSNDAESVYALCNDGSLFVIQDNNPAWVEMPPIPQDPSLSVAIKMQRVYNEQTIKLREYERQIEELASLSGTLLGSSLRGAYGAERIHIGEQMSRILGLDDLKKEGK